MNISSGPRTLVQFGVFEADLPAGDLRKKGVKVKIQDLPFRALGLLLSHPNEVVTREEFRQALWPQDVFVDFDRAISSAIKRLRDALGDSAENPIFVETVDRRGYRWIAPIAAASVPDEAIAADLALPLKSAAISETPHPPTPPQIPAWRLVYAVVAFVLLMTAWKVIPAFRNHITPQPVATDAQLHLANHDARDLYLQGRYYWNKRTPADLEKAVDFFTQAIVHDPGYSDAYVGLADCYNLLREYSLMKGTEAYPRALAAARKAVELDDRSSQAHASLAFVSFWGMWDAATADREFRRAIELDPNNVKAHHWYANCLATMRRFPEAVAEIERAQALDPTSKSILADKGNILDLMGRQQEAIILLRELEKAEPSFVSPHRYLKRIYLDKTDYFDYLAEAKQEAALTHNSGALTVDATAEKAFAAGGARAMFAAMRREQQKLYDQGGLSPYTLAQTYALEGNNSAALKYLKIAFDQHDEELSHIPADHMFDNLHDDPALRQIIAGVAIPYAGQ